MPEETANPQNQEIIDLNQKVSKVSFPKKYFYTAIVIVILFFVAGLVLAYNLGTQVNNSSSLQKNNVATSSAKEENILNLKKGFLGDKIDISSGLNIQLNEATIDQQYEQSKQDQKDYYQKNASQSSYLNSDFFHTSNLILKISLTNNNKTTVTYNPGSFRLKDSQDNQYSTPYEGQNGVNIYTLNPGETTKITVNYLVPDTETDFKLLYENAVISFSI